MKYVQARVVIFFVAQSVTTEGEKQSQNFPSPSHRGEKATNTSYTHTYVYKILFSLLHFTRFVRSGFEKFSYVLFRMHEFLLREGRTCTVR